MRSIIILTGCLVVNIVCFVINPNPLSGFFFAATFLMWVLTIATASMEL